ncbi:MAG: glycosyltransferase family 4 protein [Bryobacteraceae bacterium]
MTDDHGRTNLSPQNTWLVLIRNRVFGINRSQLLADSIKDMRWNSLAAFLLQDLWRFRADPESQSFWRIPLRQFNNKYYLEAPGDSTKPDILVVSPFVAFPPTHGGAVRMLHFIKALSEDFRVHLISDEGSAYSAASAAYYGLLASLHLIDGRKEKSGLLATRIERIHTHSHTVLREQLRMLIKAYRPRAVQIEYVELAGLVEGRDQETMWLLDAHDVLLSGTEEVSEADRHEWNLIKQFDGVLTCSPEDAKLLSRDNVFVVPNAADEETRPYVPSGGSRALLFVGPFRSLQNLEGVSTFLERVYQPLREDIGDLQLWIVAGKGGPESVRNNALFALPGVVLFDYVEDLRSLMDQCALTINPLYGVRGSCLKVIESMRAGRVCVSTRQGARGFVDSGLRPLIVVERIEDMESPVREALLDSVKRMSLECSSFEDLERFTWKHSGEQLRKVYRSLQ